ncbi:MAG: hypothetical protein U5L11_09140 [Arhodomonas sp.]|nr:hypothetical protein [Arhodomonas sp.]
MMTAALHIVGVLIALVVVMLASGIIDSYFSQRRIERILEEASVKLDLPRRGVLPAMQPPDCPLLGGPVRCGPAC